MILSRWSLSRRIENFVDWVTREVGKDDKGQGERDRERGILEWRIHGGAAEGRATVTGVWA